MRFLTILFLFSLIGVPLFVSANSLKKPVPKTPLRNSNDSGYFSIEWQEDKEHPDAVFILEQSQERDFENGKRIYKGLDRASFVSGLPDGTYYFRIRKEVNGEKSPWSRTITVNVKHHSLYLAFSLAAIGFLVFASTAGVIIKGIRTNNNSQDFDG